MVNMLRGYLRLYVPSYWTGPKVWKPHQQVGAGLMEKGLRHQANKYHDEFMHSSDSYRPK